jgi:hypothetical protein
MRRKQASKQRGVKTEKSRKNLISAKYHWPIKAIIVFPFRSVVAPVPLTPGPAQNKRSWEPMPPAAAAADG